jgi:thioester reductase-like protein
MDPDRRGGCAGRGVTAAPSERVPVAVRAGELQRFTSLELEVASSGEWPRTANDVLLTGATGFLGAFVLKALLERSDARVRCLVRAGSPEEARSRLAAALDKYGLADAALDDCAEALPGDVSVARAGLAPDQYDALAEEVDAIVHSAARVHWLAPFEELRAPNVDGTRRMLELAACGRLKSVHHVSSIGVFPYRPGVPISEDSDLDHDEPLFGGYVQTKWVAEKLVGRAAEQGLPVRTYRPGTLVGSSRTGHFSRASFLDRLLIGSVQLGSAPILANAIEMTPVDYCAEGTAALVQDPDAGDGVFHLTNPVPVPAGRLHELIAEAGYDIDREPFDSWRERLLASPDFERNALYPFRPFLATVQADQLSPPPYGSGRAQAALSAAGVVCPPVDETLIKTYFARYAAEGFL